MWWNNGMNWGAMGGGGWVVMTVLMLAFWALVVGGVVALFRSGLRTDSGSGAGDEPSAENLLDQRFARGEIDTEDYHARRAVLSSTQQH